MQRKEPEVKRDTVKGTSGVMGCRESKGSKRRPRNGELLKQERGTTCRDNVIRNEAERRGRGRERGCEEGLRPEDESAAEQYT
jgi:hypothetical protein